MSALPASAYVSKPPSPAPPRLTTQPSIIARTNAPSVRSGKYNEVIISSKDYRDLLPKSVAAVFFTQDPECATRTHRLIVDVYDIDPGQILLLKHTPGGSPGFAVHTPAKGEGEPADDDIPEERDPDPVASASEPASDSQPETHEDWDCEKPPQWCVHAGATNEYKECSGLPGHFCHDNQGGAGFHPCDEKVKATWGDHGEVKCAVAGEKEQKKSGSQSKQESGHEICQKPADWCAYPGATNEAKACGGEPGHFCHDIYGKSGFSPCDAKAGATWGTFVCEEAKGKTLRKTLSTEENAKRSQRRRAPVYSNWWAAEATSGSEDSQ